jgi:hypothetical protein
MKETMSSLINYIPIITTCFSWYFFIEIIQHFRRRKTTYLLWWSIGVLTFGLGTLAESFNVLLGWNQINLKFWYITGALLGGFPLAQGSVYLLLSKKFADITSWIIISIIVFASVFIILSPVFIPENFDYRLTGSVFAWKWVRYFSPLINIYSFIFLFGGAIYSAFIYYGKSNKEERFIGNIFIAVGALLPGIGGSFTRMGYVEVLFVTELIGLVLIFVGYKIIKGNSLRILRGPVIVGSP